MKNIFISLLVSSVLYSNLTAKDVNKLQITTNQTSKKAVKEAKQDAVNKQVKLVKEAIESLKLTSKALMDLNKKDTSSAKKDIERALGKLEVILTSKDAPKFLPIDSTISSVDFIGTKKDIKKNIKSVEKLLDDGQIQEARVLLDTLQSEIDITVVSLPLATYPNSLKLAAKYLNDNKIEEAKGVLDIALNTFNTTTHIIPLPLVKATSLIDKAEDLAKSNKKDIAIKYLDVAKDQLDIAKELGYVSKSDTSYEILHKSIKDIQKEIKGENKATKLFKKLKEKLKDFKDKIFSSRDSKNK